MLFPSAPRGNLIPMFQILTVIISLSGARPASAEVLGLYSTGVDDDGVLLTPGTMDPHYEFVSGPAGAGTEVLVQQKLDFWKGPPDGANFISTVDSGNTVLPAGDFVFRTMFDITTGTDLSKVVLTGTWMVDNSAEIFINGQTTGVSIPFGIDAHQQTHDFVISNTNGNFISGQNPLELGWNTSEPGPAGIAMSISGEVVPEPSSVAFLGALSLAGLIRYRRRNRV